MIRAILSAFTNLFKPVYTSTYPKEKIEHPRDYRGLIEHSHEHCIYCDKCENVCPPKAIVFFQNQDSSKRYNYNPYLCIYCGECVRACPKPQEALWQSEKKALPAVKEDDVNEAWFKWQKDARKSREDFAELKKALSPKGEKNES